MGVSSCCRETDVTRRPTLAPFASTGRIFPVLPKRGDVETGEGLSIPWKAKKAKTKDYSKNGPKTGLWMTRTNFGLFLYKPVVPNRTWTWTSRLFLAVWVRLCYRPEGANVLRSLGPHPIRTGAGGGNGGMEEMSHTIDSSFSEVGRC